MEFLNSKRFILIMLIVLVWAGLSSCTPSDYPDKDVPHETVDEMNNKITKEMDAMDKEQSLADNPGPTDFTGIAEVLGCMFAPTDCPIAKSKEEQELDR